MRAYTKKKHSLSHVCGHKSSDTHTHTYIQYRSALELILMVTGENLALRGLS